MNESQKKLCAELWERYEPNLRRICHAKMTGLDEDVDEILSETFLILCQKISSEGEIEYPQAWLYATLQNLIKQKYRNLKNESINLCYMSDCRQISLPYATDIDDEILNEERLTILKQILEESLSDEEKQLLYYIVDENKRYSEIAQLTDTTENTVKQRKFRLIRKIKKLAKKEK